MDTTLFPLARLYLEQHNPAMKSMLKYEPDFGRSYLESLDTRLRNDPTIKVIPAKEQKLEPSKPGKKTSRWDLYKEAKSLGFKPNRYAKMDELRSMIELNFTRSFGTDIFHDTFEYSTSSNKYTVHKYRIGTTIYKDKNYRFFDDGTRNVFQYDFNKFGEGDDSIKDVVKNALKDFKSTDKIQIMLKHDNGTYSKMVAHNKDEVMKKLTEFLAENEGKYQEQPETIEVLISVIEPLSMQGQGGKSYKQASEIWKIISPNSKTNCLFQSAQICLDKCYNDRTVSRASLLKQRVCPKNKTVSNQFTIDELSKHLKRDIIIYNYLYKVEYTAKFGVEMCRASKYNGRTRDALEILIKENHFSALLRWKDIGETPPKHIEEHEPKTMKETKDTKSIEDAILECQPIIKRNYINYDEFKVITWDIETTVENTDNETKKVITYACGFFDGDESNYQAFWGFDALNQFCDFLDKNSEKYNGFYLYAHNGGKFDNIQLMHDVLLTSDKWELDTREGKNIELNNRWISITLLNRKTNAVLFLRDSICLVPGSLDDLTKDFDVKHKKLTESVSHDDITYNNWHTYKPLLEEYLKNDVMGLYEILYIVNRNIWECSEKVMTSTKLQVCHKIVSGLTGKVFNDDFIMENKDKTEYIEFGYYNEELNLDVEYYDESHYNENHNLKNIELSFDEIVEIDKERYKLCKDNGISLLVISFDIKREDLFNYIKDRLKDMKIKVNKDFVYNCDDDVDNKVYNIKMTDCLTAATLSKKLFFHRFYNQYRYPIYMLSKEIDNYIRESYTGGRVEIFNFGLCPGNEFYYYDFTSLYPDVMRKLLPYGEPEYCKNITINDIKNDSFFGFVKVMVKTINRNIKPLHAYRDKKNFKLVFPIFEKPTELTLFSEEIKLGHSEGIYHYEIIDGIRFKKHNFMAKFENEFFKSKLKADKLNQGAIKQIEKIKLNSSYGFWGLRTEGRDSVKIYNRGDAPISEYIDNGQFIGESDVGNYTILRVKSNLDVKDFNVSVASAITSYARCKLWNLLNDIDNVGHKTFMCDTDSVITSLNIDQYPILKRRYMWDGCGMDLGSLKNELNTSKKLKSYIKENNVDPSSLGQLCFNKCILGGAKFYALRSDRWDVEICKCKGYSQDKVKKQILKMSDFDIECLFQSDIKNMHKDKTKKDLSELYKLNKNITQKQLQFLSGKSSFLCDKFDINNQKTEAFVIYKRHTPKNIHFSYTKGVINSDGRITPLVL